MAAKKEVEAVPETVEEAVPETVEVTEIKVEEPLILRAVSHILYNSRQYMPDRNFRPIIWTW